jgi:hypothetical protein
MALRRTSLGGAPPGAGDWNESEPMQDNTLIRRTIIFVAASLLIFAAISTYAQDAHHWTHQYGTRSTLLGGAVIGSVSDLSAVYYNPGALSIDEEPGILLAARVYQWTRYTFASGLSDRTDIGNDRVSPAPGLIAGRFRFGWLGSDQLAYSLLVRQRAKLEMEGRRLDTRDVISGVDGDETYGAYAGLTEDLNETWIGLTWSRHLSPNLGFGLTQFVAVRNHSAHIILTAQALASTGELAVTIQSREYDYRHIGLVWKLGLSGQHESIQYGVSLTTPRLAIYGSGDLGSNSTVTAQDIDGDGSVDSEMSNSYQDGLDAEFESPWSIGFGTAYTYRETTFHTSVEWFAGVDKFVVIELVPFHSQSSGEVVSQEITHQLDQVVNFGIGVEHSVTENFGIYGSFSTDYSTKGPDANTNMSITDWDIYHVSGGISTRVGKSDILIGLGYSFGSKTAARALDFHNASEANRLLGEPSEGEFRYRDFRFIFGFTL